MKLMQQLQAVAFLGAAIGQSAASDKAFPELESLERQLQGQSDAFHDLSFGFGGVNIDQIVAISKCGTIYSGTIYCMVQKCSNYTYDCPSLQNDPLDVAVTCQGVKRSICRQTSDESCCLEDCHEHFLSLTKCMGEGLDDCEGPVDCSVVEGAVEAPPEPELPAPEPPAPPVEVPEAVPEDIPDINGTLGNATYEESIPADVPDRQPLFALFRPDGPATIGGFTMEKLLSVGPFGALDVQETCPEQWFEFASCVVKECPKFAEVCPGVSGAKDAMAMPGNSYMESGCDDLTDDICYVVGDCCLNRCIVATQRMTTCIHTQKSGLDILGTCQVIDCAIDVSAESSPEVATSKSGSTTEGKETNEETATSTHVNTMDMNGDEEVLAFTSGTASKPVSIIFLGLLGALFM